MAAFGKSFSFSSGSAVTGGGQGSLTGGGPFGGFNQPNTGAASTPLFGATNEKRQRAGTLNESTFGGQPTAGTGGGGSLFGNTQANSANASGGGLFGNNQAANTGTNTATGGGSSFGNTQAANNTSATGGSLFGNTQAASMGTTGGGGLFGGSQTTCAGTGTGTGAFGGGSGLFGSKPLSQPTQTPSLFGQAPANTSSSGLFANQQQTQQQQQQQQQEHTQQQLSDIDELSKQLLLIKECWDPASPNFQFRHYFYNVVNPGQAHMYQCPPDQDPVLWQQAQSDNPDPSTLVPVVANGFEDLRKRVDSQSLQLQSYQDRSTEISNKLSSILQKHHSETVVRLAECRRRQADLSQRLLEFMKLLQLLRLRGQLLNPEEEIFRVRVEHLEKEMTHSGSLKQRLAELQDHTYRLQAASRRRRELLGRSGNGGVAEGYEVTDESQLESVMRMLSEKQRGLARMTQVVSLDTQSIESIESAIEERYVELQKQKEARERAQVSKSLVRPW
ncbi:nucleoporin complex subunit 54-domain-containing protein [Coemansia spiralis]|nr:nucleoporin complex subunit 54-domain-containing protein [Coemansia spiralis]